MIKRLFAAVKSGLRHPVAMGRKIMRSLMIAKGLIEANRKLREKGIQLIVVLPPTPSRLTSLTDFEKDRIRSWTFDFNHITEKDARIIERLDPEETVEALLQKYDGAKVIEKNGHKTLADFSNSYVNIVNGHRVTPDQPRQYKNTIFFYGACTVRGTGVGDDETIPAYVQRQANEKYPDTWRCVNMAIGCGSSVRDDLHRLNNTAFYKGDIAVVCNLINRLSAALIRKNGIEIWDSAAAFHAGQAGEEGFTDLPFHTNRAGNRIIASYIFSKMDSRGDLNVPAGGRERELVGCLAPDEMVDAAWVTSEGFKQYLAYLREHKTSGRNNGAIVMNCNPFTLGHRYLIETATREVEDLFVFVVEEDKSFFPFADRLALVQKGTVDLPNVHILRSGQFIISALTFPGYFYKDENKDAIVDTSRDVDLFARYIAPELGITVRFAGEEPLDPVTRQYNEAMAERLPMYGIRFCEIPRKADETNVISASRVRAAIQQGDWESIKGLVPPTTMDYLVKRFQ